MTADIFVWTKFGDDAGETIGGILARKEAERLAGSFWWGIGSSLDREKLQQAIRKMSDTLEVVFSAQLSPPKRCGFGGMTLWTEYIWDGVQRPVPDHALVISKGRSKQYYALVCNSNESIEYAKDQPFDESLFRNYPDGARPGSSQNTALLTGNLNADHGGGRYRRGFRARLIEPWLVTMANPRLLTEGQQLAIANWNGQDYHALVQCVKGF